MKANSNICALAGLLPFISLPFRGQVYLAKPSFYLVEAVSCWQLQSLCTAACAGGRARALLASSHGKEAVRVLKSVLVWGSAALSCWAGHREQWRWNDPAWHPRCVLSRKWSVAERVRWERGSLAARASQCVLNKPRRWNGSSADGKALSAASLTLLLGFGQGVLGEDALLWPVQRNRHCSLPVFGISANLPLLIIICAAKY